MQRVSSTISGDGQIIIPHEVMERLAITPGQEIVFVLEDDQVTLIPGGSVIERTTGMLRPPPGLKTPQTAEEMQRGRGSNRRGCPRADGWIDGTVVH